MSAVLLMVVWRSMAEPATSEPFESTTIVSSEVRARGTIDTGPTFWNSAMSWNAATIDVLRRLLTGMFLFVK